MRMAELKPGWAIVGNDGHRLGTVHDVGQNYIVVSRGGLSGQMYVPASHVANVENDTVHLNLTKHQAEEMGWEQPPRDQDAPEATSDTDLHRHV